MKTATVVQHVLFEDLGSFEEVLLARDFSLRTLHAGKDALTQTAIGTPDLVIFLGGPISVNDEKDFPFLDDELRFLAEWLHTDRPCLGICLGAQLMAKALGGTVVPMGYKEIGWGPLELVGETPSALSAIGQHSITLHWHGETFSIPEGARRLAESPQCKNQAFAWKNHGLALQFHPEVTPQGLESWYIGHVAELAAAGISIQKLREASATHGETLRHSAQRFLTAWLAERGL